MSEAKLRELLDLKNQMIAHLESRVESQTPLLITALEMISWEGAARELAKEVAPGTIQLLRAELERCERNRLRDAETRPVCSHRTKLHRVK